MENNILTSIIAVEQEIQQRIDAEEQLAAQTLERLRLELEEETAREEQRLAASVQQAVAAERAAALRLADAAVRSAADRVAGLDRIDAETLEGCIMKHLPRITREPTP
jgi:preprotein translocase subunit SecA